MTTHRIGHVQALLDKRESARCALDEYLAANQPVDTPEKILVLKQLARAAADAEFELRRYFDRRARWQSPAPFVRQAGA